MQSLTSYSVSDIIGVLVSVVIIIGSIMFHEIAHGYAAYKLGDPTAKAAGRLSLNPVRHLDPFGSVLLPLLLAFSGAPVIGYAKPVPYNPRYFKNRKKGELIVGLSGPAANFVLALVFAGIFQLLSSVYFGGEGSIYWIWRFCAQATLINLCLMFFNLIPLPPLDGSSIISVFLTDKGMQTYYKIERYSMPIFLIVIILIPWVTGLDPLGWYIQKTAYSLGYLLLGI